MKDLVWFAVFMLILCAVEWFEDERQFRCVERGGTMEKGTGCAGPHCIPHREAK